MGSARCPILGPDSSSASPYRAAANRPSPPIGRRSFFFELDRARMKQMASIFQTPEWEKFKLATGYSKSFRVFDILVLKKDLPLRRSMLYSPLVARDQLVKSGKWKVENDTSVSSREQPRDLFDNKSKTRDFFEKVSSVAKQENAIFYRIEFDIPKSYKLEAKSYKLTKSFEEMQPEHTLILDLTKSNEELLLKMKQKGRYNIKVAEKNKVSVQKTMDLENFYSLYSSTGKRHKITFRSKEYFQNLLDILGPKGYCDLFESYAEIEGSKTVLAAAICTYFDDKAIYMFGASSDEHKNLMAPYKMQWEMIAEAKKRKCKTYDFFGIAPDDNPRHSWAGVTRFKKQFGGEEIAIYGSYDKVYKPLEYQVFKLAEKIRRH